MNDEDVFDDSEYLEDRTNKIEEEDDDEGELIDEPI